MIVLLPFPNSHSSYSFCNVCLMSNHECLLCHRMVAVNNDSAFECSDVVLDNLQNPKNEVIYLQNMSVSPPLVTCNGISMAEMNTGLSKLSHRPILGISSPTVYIGTSFSTFPCHREDVSFCALNRHIAGSPKIWYCPHLFVCMSLGLFDGQSATSGERYNRMVCFYPQVLHPSTIL